MGPGMHRGAFGHHDCRALRSSAVPAYEAVFTMPVRAFTIPIPAFTMVRSSRSRCAELGVHDRAEPAPERPLRSRLPPLLLDLGALQSTRALERRLHYYA